MRSHDEGPPPAPPVHLSIDPQALRPLIEATVEAVLARAEDARARLGEGDRLAYSEAEAACLLGVAKHTLRDLRLRGEITGVKVAGRAFYERSELLDFLRRKREAADR
jgi:hypothetical protein